MEMKILAFIAEGSTAIRFFDAGKVNQGLHKMILPICVPL